MDEAVDGAVGFGRKVWHFIIGVLATIGFVAIVGIILTLVGIAHLIN